MKIKLLGKEFFSTNHGFRFAFIIALAASCLSSNLTAQKSKAFALKTDNTDILPINTIISKSTQIDPFTKAEPISGLTISGDITLNSDSSLVRVILVDENYNEFLVYETYPILAGSKTVSIIATGEESVTLNNTIPNRLRFEIVDASIFLKEAVLGKKGKMAIANTFKQQQNREKISNINENIRRTGGKWLAGETSVSSMSFEERKKLFGGRVPNLQGFEYYSGGIFALPGALKDKQATNTHDSTSDESSLVPEFSWRNRHGQDWVTPVKDQKSCGSCWAFSSIGATELLVNLYFNRHINLDLSEQQLVSCTNAGTCAIGWSSTALRFINSTGIVDEKCFGYSSTDAPCKLCANPAEKIRIGEVQDGFQLNQLKKMVLKGPAVMNITPWLHSLALVGYKTLKAGDTVYYKTSDHDEWVTIQKDDPFVGQTAWLLKNSWGDWFGDVGFVSVITTSEDAYGESISGPVSSMKYSTKDIACVDNDKDGYYTWGLGNKPPQCPPSPDQPDGDDSDPCRGPLNEFGFYLPSTPSPSTSNTILPIGQSQQLIARGTNIKWYSDSSLTKLIHSGDTLTTNYSDYGDYTFYATQKIKVCESKPSKVILTIRPLAPHAPDIYHCEDDTSFHLNAPGVNIKWYASPDVPLVLKPGTYHYYVTQTINNVESLPDTVTVTIVPTPLPPLAENKSAIYGQSIPDLTAQGENIKWYRTRDSSLVVGTGNTYKPTESKPGKYYYYVTQTTACESKPDTVTLTILPSSSKPIEIAVCKNSIFKVLKALGSKTKWYSDPNLSHYISEGIKFISGITEPGEYVFYFTYTYNGIESSPITVILTITPSPEVPVASSISVCERAVVPNLTATGTGIKWYADSTLTMLLHNGDNYATGKTQPGIYRYYVTQSTSDCESNAKAVDLIIHKSSELYLGKDTSILYNGSLTLNAGNNFQSYEWFNGTFQSSVTLSGQQLGMGPHAVWLKVTDAYGCMSADTSFVTVMVQTKAAKGGESADVLVYPNPNNGTLYIKFSGNSSNRVKISILDQSGKVLLQFTKERMEADEVYTVDLSTIASGTYIIRITDDKISKFSKIIRID